LSFSASDVADNAFYTLKSELSMSQLKSEVNGPAEIVAPAFCRVADPSRSEQL